MTSVNMEKVKEDLAAMIYLEQPKYAPASKAVKPGTPESAFPYESLDDKVKDHYRAIAGKILTHFDKLCLAIVPVPPTDLTKTKLSPQVVYDRKLEFITGIVLGFKAQIKPNLKNIGLIPWEELAKRVCDSPKINIII